MKMLLLATVLGLSSFAHAGGSDIGSASVEQTNSFEMTGTGVDGGPCRVVIKKNQDGTLNDVSIDGASFDNYDEKGVRRNGGYLIIYPYEDSQNFRPLKPVASPVGATERFEDTYYDENHIGTRVRLDLTFSEDGQTLKAVIAEATSKGLVSLIVHDTSGSKFTCK